MKKNTHFKSGHESDEQEQLKTIRELILGKWVHILAHGNSVS